MSEESDVGRSLCSPVLVPALAELSAYEEFSEAGPPQAAANAKESARQSDANIFHFPLIFKYSDFIILFLLIIDSIAYSNVFPSIWIT